MRTVFTLNGELVTAELRSESRLLDLLRERFGLMGAKPGCRIGRCGACAVLLDGKLVNSCLVMGYQLESCDIVTAEGLDRLPAGRAARQALAEEMAFQCGYCAPGMTVAVTALLQAGGGSDEAGLRDALGGNLCRCSGYHSILRAAKDAARLFAEQS